MRLILAFLIAPLTCGVPILVISLFSGASGGAWLFYFITIFAYGISFFIGIPAYFLMNAFDKCSLPSYLMLGICISILPVGYFVVIPTLNTVIIYGWEAGFQSQITQILLMLIACILTAFSFWIIARPDRS